MRAYFGTAPRFGVLSLPFVLLWGVLGIVFWICAGIWIVARFATQQAQRGWRAWQARRAA